ncbi:MAG: hypothetical protein ACTSP7_11260 [Candidatus Heimdallarchaeota archaeon]
MKSYSLVGKKLVECTPDDLIEVNVGVIIDEAEEMIRLIVKPEARPKQRETLIHVAADHNKKEYAGTYLVSHIENPSLVHAFIDEIKNPEKYKKLAKKPAAKKKAKKSKKKKEETEEVVETTILERWDPDLVKKAVGFLDGKNFLHISEIQEGLEITEGEAYWLTQDLVHVGIVPGRWTSYHEGEWEGHWVYQVLTDQPVSKAKKPPAKKKKTKGKKTSTKKKPSTTKKSSTKKK